LHNAETQETQKRTNLMTTLAPTAKDATFAIATLISVGLVVLVVVVRGMKGKR